MSHLGPLHISPWPTLAPPWPTTADVTLHLPPSSLTHQPGVFWRGVLNACPTCTVSPGLRQSRWLSSPTSCGRGSGVRQGAGWMRMQALQPVTSPHTSITPSTHSLTHPHRKPQLAAAPITCLSAQPKSTNRSGSLCHARAHPAPTYSTATSSSTPYHSHAHRHQPLAAGHQRGTLGRPQPPAWHREW